MGCFKVNFGAVLADAVNFRQKSLCLADMLDDVADFGILKVTFRQIPIGTVEVNNLIHFWEGKMIYTIKSRTFIGPASNIDFLLHAEELNSEVFV